MTTVVSHDVQKANRTFQQCDQGSIPFTLHYSDCLSVFSYTSSSCGILGVSSPPPTITTAETAYWVQPRATGWTVRGSTQGSTHPVVGWGPGLFSGVNRPGRGVNPLPNTEVIHGYSYTSLLPSVLPMG